MPALQMLRNRRAQRQVGNHPPALAPAAQGQGISPFTGGSAAQRRGAVASPGPSPAKLASGIDLSSARGARSVGAMNRTFTQILAGQTSAQRKYAGGHPNSYAAAAQSATRSTSATTPKPLAGDASQSSLMPAGASAHPDLNPGTRAGLLRRRTRRRRLPTLATPATPGPGLLR